MNLENQSSKSEEHKTEDLKRQVENLKRIIELQQKTQEHDRNLQLKNFKYENDVIMAKVDEIYLGNPKFKKSECSC